MRKFIYVLSTLTLLACDDNTGPVPQYGNAWVGMNASSLPIVSIAGSPRAGVPFEVTVNTFGSSGCSGVARTVVATNESGALIMPYNGSHQAPNAACTAVISSVPHRTTLTFRTAGEKTITVLARDYETGANRQVDVAVTVGQ